MDSAKHGGTSSWNAHLRPAGPPPATRSSSQPLPVPGNFGCPCLILKPFPFLPGRRIGLMVSLILRFFSLTLDQAEEVRMAHKARLGDQQRNPLRKARFLALPILRRSLSRAEDVTFALVARGYSDDIPLRLPHCPLSRRFPFYFSLFFF